jgi:hypothetical protein
MKLFGVALLFFSLSAQAKVFRNAYVAFELPDSWNCTLEHTEWVCRSEADKESKEAIIVLTAKETGPTDSFASYTQHLTTPQTAPTPGATPSRIIYPPKQVKVNEHVWIDGLHMGSEVPNYFTRYLATIKDRIAILVTFSAHKNFYTKYSQDFFKGVMSLRVIATKNLLNDPKLGPLRPGSETLGQSINQNMPSEMAGMEAMPEESSGSGSKTKSVLFGIAILLAAAAGYVLLKMRKK